MDDVIRGRGFIRLGKNAKGELRFARVGDVVSINSVYVDERQPRPVTCDAEPCAVCGGCETCGDFHSYTGRGCTDANCPKQVG